MGEGIFEDLAAEAAAIRLSCNIGWWQGAKGETRLDVRAFCFLSRMPDLPPPAEAPVQHLGSSHHAKVFMLRTGQYTHCSGFDRRVARVSLVQHAKTVLLWLQALVNENICGPHNFTSTRWQHVSCRNYNAESTL